MNYLGNQNLFTSEFVMGCELSSNKQIDCINTLHDWLDFKDNDWAMEKYRTERTQYVAFLHIIDLPVLKEIFNDLVTIYKKSYPHGEKIDFLEHIFGYTLFDLKLFSEYKNYTYYGTPSNIQNEIYYKYERPDNEFIDFIIEPSKDIEQYKQYYKKVIQLINDIDFDNSTSKTSKLSPQQEAPKHEKQREMENNIYDFFELVLSGEMGELDVENYIQAKTDNFKINKLKIFLNDIEYCLFCEREEKESEFSEKDIQDEIEKYEKKKIEIPYKTFREIKDKAGKVVSKEFKVIDLEKLLYPYHFFTIYRLIARLNAHINKSLPPQPATQINPFEEIKTVEDNLKNEIFLILQTDKIDDVTPDNFEKWNTNAMQKINELKNKHEKDQLIKTELISSIKRIGIHVNILYTSTTELFKPQKISRVWGLIPLGIMDANFKFAQFIDSFLKLLKDKEPIKSELKTPQQSKAEQPPQTINPIFKPEAIETLFDLLKDFFIPDRQTHLKTLLETGCNVKEHLIFLDNGNRLTDTFKKLIEHNFITGCQKQNLAQWIIVNFKFTFRNQVKTFLTDTVEKTISRNQYPCKSPLIEILNGQIQIVQKPRKKNITKY